MGLATPTIKALVLDLDGTFLRTDKTISRRNREVVRRCAEAGIRVIVATARPPRAVRKFIPVMPWVDCVVYYNGALVTCQAMERHTPIPPEISRRVTASIRAWQPESIIVYEVHDDWYAATPIPDFSRAVFGIAPAETMVFGDDVNDVGLFRLCGVPVAMGNAIPELRAVAAYITASNDDDSVAVAIEQLVARGF